MTFLGTTYLGLADYEQSGLYDTPLFRRLEQEGVLLADVGSRGGSKTYFTPIRQVCDFVGFDADAAAITEEMLKESRWKSFRLLPYCMWSSDTELPLHITQSPINSSVYLPHARNTERYHLTGMAVARTLKMQATTLDRLAEQEKLRRFPEVIKMDTQGAELEILRGAPKALADSMEVIISEVLFFDVYEGAPRFSDIEQFLRQSGFSFYGFIEQTFRSTRRMQKRSSFLRERLFHADAVFFRSLKHLKHQRSFDVQIIMAIMLFYYDYALELIDHAPYTQQEKTLLKEIIVRLATRMAEQFRGSTVQKLAAQPNFIDIMRIVDDARDMSSYADVQ